MTRDFNIITMQAAHKFVCKTFGQLYEIVITHIVDCVYNSESSAKVMISELYLVFLLQFLRTEGTFWQILLL